ncbi:hypothetical protein GYB62_00915 [bacterium]|nr:hypothetical protein [bacterium]
MGDKPAGDIETGVELPPLVDEIVQMMQPTLPPSLDFQVDIDNVTGTTSVDPLYFQRIVMQLLITARDDAKSNDKIRLSLSNMEYTNNMCVSCHQPIDGPHLVLSVTTANSGINPDDLQKMIDATTKNTKGAKNNVITMSHALNGHALIDHNKETISVLLLFKQDD